MLSADGTPVWDRTGEDSTQSATAATPRRTEGGVAPTARAGVPDGTVDHLEDWVGPARVGSVSTGMRPGTGTEPSPAHRGRPITEYQPSEYGDFPPALVGDELDLASAASVASQSWRGNGVRGTAAVSGNSWTEGGGRYGQRPGVGQTSRQGYADGGESTAGGPPVPPRPHRRPRPGGDSSRAGVMTRPDGGVRPAGGAGRDGAAARPSPPDIQPFIDSPSLQRPEYDRTPWQPLLPTSGQRTSGQRTPVSAPPPPRPQAPRPPPPPPVPELGGVQTSPRPGQGSVWPGEVVAPPEEHRRGPERFTPARQETVLPVSDPHAPRPEDVRPRPAVNGLNPGTVLPAAFWPRPALPKFRRPSQSSRPPSQKNPTVSSFLPSADKIGAGFLQMLSELVLARTKPDVLSRTEPTGQVGTELAQTETEEPQSGTEQSQSETEQVQSSDVDDQLKTDEPVTLPPLTVVLKPVPVKSNESVHETELSTSPDVEEETTTDIQSEMAENNMQTTKLPVSKGSAGTSAVPDIIISFNAVNSTPSQTKKLPAQPSLHLPDKLVRKTLTIVSYNNTEDSPYVTHLSGIISKSPLGSSDLLDHASPPTTAAPSRGGHHAETSEVSGQVTGSEVRDLAGQLVLTEDGDFVTPPSVVSLQTVPPHLHYGVGAAGFPGDRPTLAGAMEMVGHPPVVPSPPGGTSRPLAPDTEGDTTAVTVTPEQDWERYGHVTKPFFQPVTSYSGVYPPSRPKPPSLPHPEYPSTDPDPVSFTTEEDDDYLYYDTEIFTEKNSVQSIFDMFSTRKPLVLDTDVVTSTSVREEQPAPERRLLLGLLRGGSRRQSGSGRARGPSRRVKVAAAGGEREEIQLRKGGNTTTAVLLGGEAVNEVTVSTPNRREKRSLSWLRVGSPREEQHDLPKPVSAPRSRQHAARGLRHSAHTSTSSHSASAQPSYVTSPDGAPPSGSLSARRIRRPSSYGSQSVASLATRLRLAATPTARPRRGSRLRLPPRREKLADKLMRFRGVRSRGIFATTARPERRWRAEGTTRLPNSAPIHVIKYDDGATVDDILDSIFGTRREFDASRENEVGLAEGAGKEAASTTMSSALWKTSDVGESWQGSEKAERWSPMKDSVPWSTSGESGAGVDRMGQMEESSPSSHAALRLSANRLHAKDRTQTANIAGEDSARPNRPTTRPATPQTAQPTPRPSSRPSIRSPTRPTSRPARPASRPTRPSSRPTASPAAVRPAASRPVQKWRPVRFRLPTRSDWPKVTEPPRLADKLSRLTTSPAPAVVAAARPAPAAAGGQQLVADTDNEVGTAARPSAVVPTRPTLASLLSNYTYPGE